jgi:hypothetical protein
MKTLQRRSRSSWAIGPTWPRLDNNRLPRWPQIPVMRGQLRLFEDLPKPPAPSLVLRLEEVPF